MMSRALLVIPLMLIGFGASQVAAHTPDLLDPLSQPQFVNQLPNPLDPSFIFPPLGNCSDDFPDDCEACYRVGAFEFDQGLGLYDPETGEPLLTRVWGYGTGPTPPDVTYPGRTFEVVGDEDGVGNQKTCVHWTNDLVDEVGEPLPHLLPVDSSLHWAFSLRGYDYADYLQYGVPIVTHVHGGHTESDSDGLPEHWWTPDEGLVGPHYVKNVYEYDNDQQAGTIWYHDHALGITRLNVYAGLAGFYIIRDDRDTGRPDNPLNLPAFPYEVALAIQDRQFTEDGQLFYPTVPDELAPGFPPPPTPSALPEFFGDVILVNGQAWPVLDVEPRKYRLRFLNGSDSRFYNLWIGGRNGDPHAPDGSGPAFTVIGTDTGLLHRPVAAAKLTIGPGERYDVVVDFAGHEGRRLIVRNNARSPFPKGDTVEPRTTGRIMAFRVGRTVTVPDEPIAAQLRPKPIDPNKDLGTAARTRKLLLFEGIDQFGRLQPMLGTAEPVVNVEGELVEGTMLWDDHLYPITENPMLDDVEVWEVYNATADAHPIHLHLVSFQILGRQKFRGTVEETALPAHDGSVSIGGVLRDVRLLGQPKRPLAKEAGWKDTAIMLPGEVTRVTARFDREGLYVWHCHILSHEDHEMMRPYYVGELSDGDAREVRGRRRR